MRIRSSLVAIIVGAALCGACAVKTVATKALVILKKAKVELHCTPTIGFGAGFGPIPFMAFLKVRNPGEKFWCPAVQWYVDGMPWSSHESDCDPYEVVTAQEGREPEVWSEPVMLLALPRGRHIITARLLRATRVVGSQSCEVQAH